MDKEGFGNDIGGGGGKGGTTEGGGRELTNRGLDIINFCIEGRGPSFHRGEEEDLGGW